MARFPEREADIKALAQNIISGLINNPDFPDPPVAPADLQALLDAFINAGDDQVAAQQTTEATLNNQDRGKEWEYRVIGANKAGEGEPSNTVMAVL